MRRSQDRQHARPEGAAQNAGQIVRAIADRGWGSEGVGVVLRSAIYCYLHELYRNIRGGRQYDLFTNLLIVNVKFD